MNNAILQEHSIDSLEQTYTTFRMGANNNDVAPFVTEWEVEDVDPDDIVVVR